MVHAWQPTHLATSMTMAHLTFSLLFKARLRSRCMRIKGSSIGKFFAILASLDGVSDQSAFIIFELIPQSGTSVKIFFRSEKGRGLPLGQISISISESFSMKAMMRISHFTP
jgi:hypothetical protein